MTTTSWSRKPCAGEHHRVDRPTPAPRAGRAGLGPRIASRLAGALLMAGPCEEDDG